MFEFVLMIALAFFVLIFALGMNIVSLSSLKSRVSRLERMMEVDTHSIKASDSSQSEVSITGEDDTLPKVSAMSGEVMKQSVPGEGFKPKNFHDGDALIAWIQKDFLMKIGGLFILMALGWFVSYAFANEWIGPAGRIAFGLLVGTALLALGVWRIRLFEHQGAVFTVLGSSTIILVISAGRDLYGFFTPMSALGLILLSVFFVTFVSLKYSRNSLAFVSLLLASFSPHLVSGLTWDAMEQFSYLLVIVLGTLWVAYVTGWRNLTLAALLIVFFETSPYLVTYGTEKTLVLLWIFLFVAIFFIANMISIVRVKGEVLSKWHLLTALGTVLFLVLWVFGVAPEEMQSLLFVFWMLVFSFGTYIVYHATANRIPFYVYGGASLTLLGSATAAELEGPVLVIAFTLEIAAIVFLARFFALEDKVVKLLSLLFALPVLLSLESMVSSSWNRGILHGDFFVLVIVGLALFITGLFIVESNRIQGKMQAGVGVTLLVAGSLYGLLLIWLVLHSLLKGDTATMVALMIYTVIGVLMYMMGRVHNNEGLRIGGGFLIGCVIVRLLMVEVWNMGIVGRIITFSAIGVMLISTAFMHRGHKNQVTPPQQ